ncbi:MAG TPA: 2-oxo acid dehydrogenase subunit E2 [Streptosporangiaceae bacterium]|jgi:pyruvate/2-oxoglutarate dehydrogenase complex dihydrolipoamide acyltransferase (E2) component
MGSARLARERYHTLYFLRYIRSFAPVFLDTEIDMTQVTEHRAAQRLAGRKYSVVSYLLLTAGRVLSARPEANALISGRFRRRIRRPETVNGKLTLDKTLRGQRVVLATVLTGLERASLDQIQDQVDHFRDGDPAVMPEFAPVRLLHRLPAPAGELLFRLGVGSLRRRPALLGTFALTSLGHQPVDSFHSVGGTTITLGAGQITQRPVVRDGQVVAAPVMRLSLAFDHRVIDGAEAAEVLAGLKSGLEHFRARAGQRLAEPVP